MTTHEQLTPASALAMNNGVRFLNESDEYRSARDALLAKEIELRCHIERVAEQRRALPAGGKVPKNYAFVGENGPVAFADLFGNKQTLAIYSYMYRPKHKQPCPMCTSLLSAWDGESLDANQRIALVMVARSPIERLLAFKKERGWRNLKLYSDAADDFTPDFVSADDADMPAFNVFTRRDGTILHFWSGEMGGSTAKNLALRLTSCRCGRFWTTRLMDAEAIGIRSSITTRNPRLTFLQTQTVFS